MVRNYVYLYFIHEMYLWNVRQMFNAFNSNMSYISWPARLWTVDKTKGRQGRSQGKAKEKDSTCSAAAGTAAEEGTVSHDLILENIHIQNRYIYVCIYIS